jgi:hypothetical protein
MGLVGVTGPVTAGLFTGLVDGMPGVGFAIGLVIGLSGEGFTTGLLIPGVGLVPGFETPGLVTGGFATGLVKTGFPGFVLVYKFSPSLLIAGFE